MPAFIFPNKQYAIKTKLKHLLPATLVLLLSSCGLLVPTPDAIDNYPDDFSHFLNENNLYREYTDAVYFLAENGVDQIVPAWQLFQQGTDWKKHKLPKYAIPPREHWSKMLNTLIFLKYELVPQLGPLKVVSGFRTHTYNRVGGGAGKSRHLTFSALDLQPVNKIARDQLHGLLRERWNTLGKQYNLGLGLYSGVRFHIDTGGYRQW